jgi:hypothetical protein
MAKWPYCYWLLLRGGILQRVPRTAYILHISVLIFPDSSTRALWPIPAETPGSKAGETWREMFVNFASEASLSYSGGIFIMA